MTTTARIVATTAASTAYTASILAGSVGNFKAHDLLAGDEPIVFEGKDAAGVYEAITYINPGGVRQVAQIIQTANTIQLVGPIDFRINKPITKQAVEVSEYT